MKKALWGLMVTTMLLIAALPIMAAAGQYNKYLTVPDVEKVSGLSGIKIVPYDPSQGAGGDLNFATVDGELVLMANFLDGSNFKRYKNKPRYIKAPVAGVGEEAYSGPKNDPQSVLIFRKSIYCVTLGTFLNMSGNAKSPTTMLTMDQLIALGKLVASRLK